MQDGISAVCLGKIYNDNVAKEINLILPFLFHALLYIPLGHVCIINLHSAAIHTNIPRKITEDGPYGSLLGPEHPY